MQTAHPPGTSELAILARVLGPDQATLSVPAAEAILDLGFSRADRERMRQLSTQARAGTLTPEEQDELNNYEKVGHLLSMMKSKARCSLKGDDPAGDDDKAH